jgi:cyclopropane-fatty-acyl-phospholipid synthase
VTTRVQARDARAIAHHYDVSNDFYALFLDPLMVYTCAYYRDPHGKLEQAQQDKLDHVCRKLELSAGQTLLDIGCGWGSLALWAARHYGVRAAAGSSTWTTAICPPTSFTTRSPPWA